MANYLVIGLILVILGSAVFYIYRSKKKGKQCVGCPCGGKCNGSCGQ